MLMEFFATRNYELICKIFLNLLNLYLNKVSKIHEY